MLTLLFCSYVLEQHLHRDEALRPTARDYGLFKGEHRVFRRADVLSVKSTENWYRQGRAVRPDEIPRKFVKQRAVTINSRRKEEFMKMDGGEVDEQPLFSEDQTDVYVPPPVKDVRRLVLPWRVRVRARDADHHSARAGQGAQEQLWQHRPLCPVHAPRGRRPLTQCARHLVFPRATTRSPRFSLC